MIDHLATIASESQRFAEVLAEVDPDRPCPTCPEWSASDLLWHLTEVHFFWAAVLQRRVVDEAEIADVERTTPSRPETVEGMLGLRHAATSALLEQLEQRADGEPCWSWWPADQTVGFTRRMQTYEATMHRVDAELTAEQPVAAIAADVAAGALDHAVDIMWGWMPDGASYRADATVEFVSSDTDQRWLVEVGSWTASGGGGFVGTGSRAVRASHGKPTAIVTGPVVDLAMWAWVRGGVVDFAGETASVAVLSALVAQGMQ